MPYRVDVRGADADAVTRLIDLGALDAELFEDGSIAAIMPDRVGRELVTSALGVGDIEISPAIARDNGSVWLLSPGRIRIGSLWIVPADHKPEPGTLRLVDSSAFGTGLHPTTSLCLEALLDVVRSSAPVSMLDVGTGSGVLALAALMLGVTSARGIDIDERAVHVAAENAKLNSLDHRLTLQCCGPGAVSGTWPLVMANVLPGPLIEMAPALVQRIGRQGTLVLSGIAASIEEDVERAYRRLGMRRAQITARDGWVAVEMRASW